MTKPVLDIIGTISKTDPRVTKTAIECGATLASIDKLGDPQMYYRWKTIKCNDDTTHEALQYLSYCALWQGSSINIDGPGETKFLQIVD